MLTEHSQKLHQLAKIDSLPELATYQAQPKQMKAAAHGKVGILEMRFEPRKQKSVLSHLYRVAPLLVQQGLYFDESWPELPIVSIISVGGGTLQGDRYHIDIEVKKNAVACVTTQSATRIQQMNANYATQYQCMKIEKNAYLEYIPDTTILYKGSRYACENHIVIEDNAILLYGETIMLGRKHHNNERLAFDLFSSSINVFNTNNQLLFSEKILINKEDATVNFNAIMQGYDVFSNVLCLLPEKFIPLIENAFPFYFDEKIQLMFGVSLLPNNLGLMLRVVGKESYQVQAKIKSVILFIKELIKAERIEMKEVMNVQ